ncbi:MAG TPA: hypothetical protein VK966_05120, partial [Longimicrobiales bacterium]|nr:hypothetical protein [Longimicrobiales bacterium]
PGIRRIYDVASALGLESLVDHFFPVNARTEVRVVHGEYLTFESETEGVTIESELLEEPAGYVRIRFAGEVEDSVVTQVKLTYAPGGVESFAVDFPATVLEQTYYPARESTVSGEWIPLYFPHGTDPGAPHLVDVSYQCTNSTPAEWECVNGYYTAHRWRTESYEQPIWLPNPGLDVYVSIRLSDCYTMASTGDESCGQYDSYRFYVR